MLILVDQKEAGRRLDALIRERLPEFSRSRIQEWIRSGLVLVDGRAQRASFGLRGGEKIDIEPAELPPLKAEAENIPLVVLYEDEHFVAIDKPAGMVVHAGAGVSSGTVVNALLHRFGNLSSIGGGLRPGIVHRLDRYTSGVLLVAKTDAMHRQLSHLFASRQVRKTYIALVHHSIEKMRGRIEKPIARDPQRRTRMTARVASGRAAWSEYVVLENYAKFALIEVLIGTGRTHQIRVHLSSIGHPIVGDKLYGAPAQIPGLPSLGRTFLHARCIEFKHPATGEELRIQSPLPNELVEWLNQLKALPGNLPYTKG